MRALILPAAALTLAGAVVLLVGGRMVEGPTGLESAAVAQSDLEDEAVTEAVEPVLSAAPNESTATGSAPVETPSPSARSRLVAPALVAPPEIVEQQLKREPPREPLSSLSLALPPPEHRNPWAGKPLFRPLAVESAVFESGGYTVAIDGVKSIGAEETCSYEGVSWPCGIRARTAFRLWLRGRALVCQIPEGERDEGVLRARCRLAKQDAGAWLVSNGWALAEPDGPYVQAEEKARAAKMGIFGAPPDASSVPEIPDAPAAFTEPQPVMADDIGDDLPPLTDPRMAFPPAPPAP